MQLSFRRNGHRSTAACHAGPQANTQGLPEVAIAGSPNVGKSLLFQHLTGAYVDVSNYSGTTVEVFQGQGEIAGQRVAFVDTPGMYSLMSITEDERVARSILLRERPAAVIHVVDAKNLARMLSLTLQLLEADLPVVLVVNIMDEAEQLGIHIDTQALEEQLQIPVVATVSTTGQGIDQLKRRLATYVNGAGAGHPVSVVGKTTCGAGFLALRAESQDAALRVEPQDAALRVEPQDAALRVEPQDAACQQPFGPSGSTARPRLRRAQPRRSPKSELAEVLRTRPGKAAPRARFSSIEYEPPIEQAIHGIVAHLRGQYQLSRRAVALLLLQGDEEFDALVCQQESPADVAAIQDAIASAQAEFSCSLRYLISLRRQAVVRQILDGIVTVPTEHRYDWGERLSQAMMNPWTGVPIVLLVLLALYAFVGVFGAQTLVDFLEGTVFEGAVNPWVERVVAAVIPWPTLRALFAGPYGIITLGIRYAIALILPIVGTFFIAFSLIEDSGYLPRLAMLIDGVFKRIGLNGRAVIPMVLGFGCDTMATIVTRTLETKRERVIATMLLALAIPCSAQLGVILAILAGHPVALGIWLGVVAGIFLLVGSLTARLMPGQRPSFYMELPPLRWPKWSNVLLKTYTRMEWYLREVIPFFILASVLIWIGQVTGLFDLVVKALQPVVRLLGLPDEAVTVFLFGFFRRDYGAAGLYDIQTALNGVQLAVAAVTLTLFVPCIAQSAIMWKERGPRTTLGIVAFIFPFAFLVGALLNLALTALGTAL